MRTFIQRQSRSKSVLKQLFSALALGGIALSLSLTANAQPFGSDCTTTSIDISTGIDYTGTIIPYPTSGSTQDPYWSVTMLPTNTCTPALPTPPYCAELVSDANGTNPSTLGQYVQSGSAYISFATDPTVTNYGSGCGMFNTYDHSAPGGPIGGALPVRLTRQFYIEGASNQNVTIDISGFGDDIVFIAVDQAVGTPIYTTPASPNMVYYNATTSTTINPMTASVTLNLAPGAHTLDVDLYDISAIITAASLRGRITCANQVLAKNTCYGLNGCGEIVDPQGCDDVCYWTVDGNNINPGRNKFGTLTDDNINIVTNNDYRGVITSGAPGIGNSFIGWNTMNPTSILHVDCIGNHEDGSGMSDIRFENLEHGSGNILVIDDQGHVFRTDYNIEDIMGGGSDDGTGKKMADAAQQYDELKTKYDKLQQDFNSMSARLDALQNCCANNGSYSDMSSSNNTGSALYQNTPNPFSNETTVEYYVHSMKSNAYVVLYDLNGRELNRYAITETGKGFVTISSDKMVAGMYLYSLVIDGQEVDSKKMVLSKNN